MTNHVTETNQSKQNFAVEDVSLFINGEFVDSVSKKTFANLSPFSNETINLVAEGDKEDINVAVESAKTAFETIWKTMKISERMVYINRIADLIDEEAEEIARLEAIDTGLPISQTKKQAARAAMNFRFYAKMVESTLHGEAYQVDDEFINYNDLQTAWGCGVNYAMECPIYVRDMEGGAGISDWEYGRP